MNDGLEYEQHAQFLTAALSTRAAGLLVGDLHRVGFCCCIILDVADGQMLWARRASHIGEGPGDLQRRRQAVHRDGVMTA